MINFLRNKTYQFLRSSEEYAQTDMVYLAKGGFWLTLGNAIAALSGFLLSLCFANLLPKEVYGEYRYVLSIAALMSIATLQGMSTAVTRAIAQGLEGVLLPALRIKIRWGLWGAAASLALAGYYFFYNNFSLTTSFLVVAAFLPLMDSFSLFSHYLNGKKDFKNLTKYNAVIQLLSIGTMIATLLITNKLFFILIAYFVSNTLLRFIFLKIILRRIPANAPNDQETLSYGKHLSLLAVLSTIVKSVDQIIIFHFVGTAALAAYSIAAAPVKELQGLIRNINPLSMPKLAEKEFSDIQKTLPLKTLKFFALIALMVGGYIVLVPFFYHFFYPQYPESIKYSQWFSLNLLFYPFILFNTALTAHAKQKEIYQATISSSVFYLAALFILTYLYGLTGVIAAVLLNSLVGTIINFTLFKKRSASPPADL